MSLEYDVYEEVEDYEEVEYYEEVEAYEEAAIDESETVIPHSFSQQSEFIIPADFCVVSHRNIQQRTLGSEQISPVLTLPDPADKSVGILTTILLDVLRSSRKSSSLRQIADDVRVRLKNKTLTQVPHFSYSKILDIEKSTFEFSRGNGTKRAVLVGINYANQKGELKSSHENMKSVKKYIEEIEEFPTSNIDEIIDDGTSKSPTRENIMTALQKLVAQSQPGDSVFFYYTGKNKNYISKLIYIHINIYIYQRCDMILLW